MTKGKKAARKASTWRHRGIWVDKGTGKVSFGVDQGD